MKKITIFISSLLVLLTVCFTSANAQTFYGMASQGGSHGKGTLFKCTALGVLTVLVNFDSTNNGATPYGSLVQASDGNFYGMTYYGGSSGKGTLFKCTPSGALTTLVNFSGANGAKPNGTLIQATDGNLYGMTSMGGTSDSGTLFKCTLTGSLTTLVSFSTAKGTLPLGSLLQANDGNLYGMTSSGGDSAEGVLFKYDISLSTYTNMFSFARLHYGDYPYSSLIQAYNGLLYGVTVGGGTGRGGTLFSSTLTGSVTRLYNFDGTGIGNAGFIYGRLLQATDTLLFGLSSSGPDFTFGTLFRFNISGNAENIYTFTGCPAPSLPRGSLIQSYDGNLYGMSTYGGGPCLGLIMKSTPNGAITTIASFNDTNGAYPYGDLIEASFAGVQEYTDVNAGIKVFPVPAKDNITVTISGNSFSPNTLTIYHVTGRKLIEESISKSEKEIPVNTASLPAGVYLLKITSEEALKMQRFIIVR